MHCYYIQMAEVPPDSAIRDAILHDFVVFANYKDEAKFMVMDAMRDSPHLPCGFTVSRKLEALEDLAIYLHDRYIKILSRTYYPSAEVVASAGRKEVW